MACAAERVFDDLGEPAVHALPLARRQPLIEHRREQRVREADRVLCELEHVLVERRLEYALLDSCGAELACGQSPVR